MITGRVLSERVVSVSLSNGGLSGDGAPREEIRFSSHRFKTLMAKQDLGGGVACRQGLTAPNHSAHSRLSAKSSGLFAAHEKKSKSKKMKNWLLNLQIPAGIDKQIRFFFPSKDTF